MGDTPKGTLWAFVAVLAMSNVYIFSKAALNEVELVQFGFYWFFFGLLWNLIFALKTCKLTTFLNLRKKQLLILGLIGMLEIVGTTAFFTGIRSLDNPGIASFLANMTPVFVTLLGISVLRERFTILEGAGMGLTVIGAVVISYQGQGQIHHLFLAGAEFIVISSLVFAVSTIVVKRNVLRLPPALLSLNRVTFLFLFSTIMLLITGESLNVGRGALINMGIGSMLGPFLAVLASYNALKYIEASRQSILGSTKGLFVLAGSYLYFQSIPAYYQVVGGIVTIIGVILVVFGRRKVRKSGNPEA